MSQKSNYLFPTTLILMAAGESRRFCDSVFIKKQWLRVDSKPLWLFVADRIKGFYPFEKIIITASALDMKYMSKMCKYDIVQGGQTRQESLQNALEQVQTDYVLVTDAARWNVTQDIISCIFSTMQKNQYDCIAPKINIPDTIIYNNMYINREEVFRIQTPQLCKTIILKNAIKAYQGTDESSIIQAYGGKVCYVQGDERLAKITYVHDLQGMPLDRNEHIIFVGNGIDVHGFEENKKMVLGGVEIKSNFGFKAHSDGDVALHAIIDSILGAMGAGDIGEWFPDTNEEFYNIDSSYLLRYISDFARSVGFLIQNIDITIVAQKPRISLYKKNMQETISDILRIPLWTINIKATTTEYLGFIGRSEGVCVIANTTLKLMNWRDIDEIVNFRK